MPTCTIPCSLRLCPLKNVTHAAEPPFLVFIPQCEPGCDPYRNATCQAAPATRCASCRGRWHSRTDALEVTHDSPHAELPCPRSKGICQDRQRPRSVTLTLYPARPTRRARATQALRGLMWAVTESGFTDVVSDDMRAKLAPAVLKGLPSCTTRALEVVTWASSRMLMPDVLAATLELVRGWPPAPGRARACTCPTCSPPRLVWCAAGPLHQGAIQMAGLHATLRRAVGRKQG